VVVVLIAMMAGASGGLYLRSYQKRVAEKAAAELLQTALYARIVAIERNQPCKMYLDPETGGFFLAIDIADEQGILLEERVINNLFCRPAQLPESMMFENIQIRPYRILTESLNYNNNVIIFAPNGTADLAVVQIGDGFRHYTLSISSSTARPHLIRGTIEDVIPDTFDLDAQWLSTENILKGRLP